MNSNSVTLAPTPTPAPEIPLEPPAAGDQLPESSPVDPKVPGACRGGRANGKIARLPKPIRDQINHWLLDGVSYPDIVQRLREHGKDLVPDNISQWKKRGHQAWLVEQGFIERTRARQETPGELVRDFDATEVNHAALQLGALHMFEALRDLGPGSLDKKLGGDSVAFVRLLNALARTSRETIVLQKYREACAKARAALHELKDPKRKLSDSERRAIVRHVDDILGISSDDIDDEPEPDLNELPTAPTTPPPDSMASSSSSSPASETLATTA